MPVGGGVSTATARKSYVPVPLDIFSANGGLGFSLYGRRANGEIVPLCRAGQELSEGMLAQWRQSGFGVLYVDTAEHQLYQRYAESECTRMSDRADLPAARKMELCYKTTLELVREAVDSSSPEQVVGERREQWVGNLVSLIYEDTAAVESIASMLSHDYYTYTHMVNVSVMVTLLAYRLGERDRERLRAVASGGLLHDIGKLRIKPEVLNKVGALSAEEWEELRSHPDVGLSFLHGRSGIRPGELHMVHQHHEKLNGSGYPLGLVGSEISLEAQMAAVVDIYDALTCKRPYRSALPHKQAVTILAQEARGKLNPEMVRVWTEVMNRVASEESGRVGHASDKR